MGDDPSIDELSRILGRTESELKNANYRLNDLRKWLSAIDRRLDEIVVEVNALEEWRKACEKSEQRLKWLFGSILAMMNLVWGIALWILGG